MSRRLVCLVLGLVTLLVFLPVWHHGFIAFDDDEYLVNNPIVKDGLTWAGFKWAFTTFHMANWHPLSWLSHMLDCQLFGPHAGAHHFVSVLFHAANAILLFVVWHRMTGALWPAALIAALFAWHPLHVESVAWAAERKDVLSTLFWILTVWAYAGYAQSTRANGSPIRQIFRSRGYCLAVVCFALGLMAKPMLVTVPFALLLLDFWPLRRVEASGWGRQLFSLAVEKWPFFLLSGASSVVTYLAQSREAVNSLEEYSWALRLGNASLAYAGYLIKTIWPANLAVLYPAPYQLAWARVLAAVVVLTGISAAVWHGRQRRPYLLVGWLWFLGTLVPVIGLVKVGSQAMADRYTYVPLIGIFVMVAYGGRDVVARLALRAGVPATITGVILAGCLLATSRQLRHWEDSETLFRHAVVVTRNNVIACAHYADALVRKGRTEEAATAYREVLRVAPLFAEAHQSYAQLLESQGQLDEALRHYQEAVRLKPGAASLSNLAALLMKLDRLDEALPYCDEAVRLDPANPRPHYLKGKVRYDQQRSSEAIGHFRHALNLDPDNLATLTWLSRILSSDLNPQNRSGAEAVVLAERANRLSGGRLWFVLDTLAMAYAEAGRFDLAQVTISNAIATASAAVQKDEVATLEQRLRLYQSHRPYREAPTNAPPPKVQH